MRSGVLANKRASGEPKQDVAWPITMLIARFETNRDDSVWIATCVAGTLNILKLSCVTCFRWAWIVTRMACTVNDSSNELVLLSVGLEVQKRICNPGNSERSNVVRVHHNGRRASRREHRQYGMDLRVHGVHAGRLVGLGKRRNNEFAHRRLRSVGPGRPRGKHVPVEQVAEEVGEVERFPSWGFLAQNPVLGSVPFACDPTSLPCGSWNVTPAAIKSPGKEKQREKTKHRATAAQKHQAPAEQQPPAGDTRKAGTTTTFTHFCPAFALLGSRVGAPFICCSVVGSAPRENLKPEAFARSWGRRPFK